MTNPPARRRDAVAALGGLHAGRRRRAARARGSVHATDAEHALQNARDVYARRGKVVSIWVVPTDAIMASSAERRRAVLRSRRRQGVPPSAVLQGASRRRAVCERERNRPPRLTSRGSPGSPRRGRPRGSRRIRCSSISAASATIGSSSATGSPSGAVTRRFSRRTSRSRTSRSIFVGQATLLLKLAGEIEGKGRDEDALAYFRDAIEFRNVQLVELPNGDFAFTIVRQFLFDAYDVLVLERLTTLLACNARRHRGARRSRKRSYHVRHSAEWVVHAGRRDGGEPCVAPSVRWTSCGPLRGELFETDAVDQAMIAEGIGTGRGGAARSVGVDGA